MVTLSRKPSRTHNLVFYLLYHTTHLLLGSLQLIDKFRDEWKWVLVFPGNHIQSPIVLY